MDMHNSMISFTNFEILQVILKPIAGTTGRSNILNLHHPPQ